MFGGFGTDHQAAEAAVPLADGLYQRHTLRANGGTVAGVFDVAPRNDGAVFGFQRAPNRKAGVFHISLQSSRTGVFFERHVFSEAEYGEKNRAWPNSHALRGLNEKRS